jgi:hypothetical protein
MRLRLWCLSLLVLPACALAFTPGLQPAPAPAKFQDIENSPSREEQKKEGAGSTTPTVGLSLVVGGKTLDAGALPKPPIPVVLLP